MFSHSCLPGPRYSNSGEVLYWEEVSSRWARNVFQLGNGHACKARTAIATLSRGDFVQEYDHTVMHGELNTGKAKTIPGHGCESAVSHVAGIAVGMGGQRAQSQDYTNARAGVQSQD